MSNTLRVGNFVVHSSEEHIDYLKKVIMERLIQAMADQMDKFSEKTTLPKGWESNTDEDAEGLPPLYDKENLK